MKLIIFEKYVSKNVSKSVCKTMPWNCGVRGDGNPVNYYLTKIISFLTKNANYVLGQLL